MSRFLKSLFFFVSLFIMSCTAYALPIGVSSIDESVINNDFLLPPYPVYIVDEPFDVLESDTSEYSLLSLNDSAYLGTISTAIYDYFRDISASLPLGVDYVFYRANRYDYRLVYGNDLVFNNGVFSGSDVNVINYYSYTSNDSNYITRYTDSSFRLTDPGAFVYTSLGEGYPRLFEGVTHREFTALLIIVAVACLYSFIMRIFKY